MKKKSESIFGPLILFNLRYIKVGVRVNNNVGIKSAQQISYGCSILDKLGSCPNDFQNHNTTVTFFKNCLQLDDPRGYF